MIKRLGEQILGRDINLRERVFRVILMLATLMTVLGYIEEILLSDGGRMALPMLGLFAMVTIAVVVNFKYHRVGLSAWILGLTLILGVFPVVFFFSGGINGGATNWFILGVIYVFLMFSGGQMYFLLTLSLVVDVGCYVIGYKHPEYIEPLGSREMVFFDSAFSVILIAYVLGIIMKFQTKVYVKEREVTVRQKEEIEETGQAKNLFFAKISHELRTPINTVIGLNEINMREKLPPEVVANCGSIQQASVMLLALVNELLDMSQIEMSRMTLFDAEYDMKTVIFNLVDIIQIRMRAKKLDFRVEADENLPTTLYGDEKRVNQIMINLLTNAVKYTENGHVALRLHAEPAHEEGKIFLVVSVQDTGIGVRKEDIPYLFDYFHRIDEGKTHKIEGSGLGLSITKQLVEMMGGDITVDSIYTKGSTFTFRIVQEVVDDTPIGPVDFLARMRGRQQMMMQRQMMPYAPQFVAPEARILIVDDSEMNQEVLRKLLKETKVQVETAGSGQEALDMTLRRFYHLIFMDYMMPDMDGAQTLQEIRRQEGGICQETPIVCLTGNARTDSGSREMSYGFDGYLQKPVRGEVLEQAVLKFLPQEIIEYVRAVDGEDDLPMLHVANPSTQHKRRVCITTNGISDMGREQIERLGVHVIYPFIETEKGRFLDAIEIDSKNITKYLSISQSNVTAISPTVERYETFFADTLTIAEDIIHISVAPNIGDSYENATTAAKSFDHVRVVNSGQLSGGIALLVRFAAQLARDGASVGKILDEVEQLKGRIVTMFLFPSVGVLAQGGYVNSMLTQIYMKAGLHPIAVTRGNGLRVVSFRGGSIERARKRFISAFGMMRKKINTDIVYITHVSLSVKELDYVIRELRKIANFDQVVVERASVANACSSGIGTIGISFFRK